MEQAEKQTTNFMTKIEGDNTKGYHLQVYSHEKEQLIDLSTLVGDITYYTSMLDNPGKLTFFVQKDPNGILNSIHNGDKVFFKKDGVGIFSGYVFTVGIDGTQVFKITAYDQLRYLKNEDSIIINSSRLSKKKTVSEIFEDLCIKFKLKYKVISPISFVPPSKIYSNKTIYAILRDLLSLAEIDSAKNQKPTKYIIRDNYGVLELRTVESLKTNVVIGEQSLLSSYQFETSIDGTTYTQIKVTKNFEKKKKEDKKEKNMIITVRANNQAQKYWGVLQKVVQANDNMNKAQTIALAEQWLKYTCRESKSLKLSAIGVMGMNAGVGFRLILNDLNANLDMYILNATHKFTNDFHTMDLEVNANDLELYYK